MSDGLYPNLEEVQGLRSDAIVETRGRPLMDRSDNGTELTSRAILRWQEDNRIECPHRASKPS